MLWIEVKSLSLQSKADAEYLVSRFMCEHVCVCVCVLRDLHSWVLGLLSKILQRCHKNSVNPNEAMAKLTPSEQFLEQTRQSPDPGVFPEDCTLGEYMEKILLYGYLMVSNSHH
jgi:hypothetical protein